MSRDRSPPEEPRPPARSAATRFFPLAVAGLALAVALWPARAALVGGTAAGAGPDVVVTMWGMRFFAHEWAGPAWAGPSNFANFPHGTVGSVLAPVTSALWALVDLFTGPAAATTWTTVLTLAGWSAGVSWLAYLSGVSRPASALAGVLALSGRYLVYASGEASVVGITGLPALLGVGALMRVAQGGGARWIAIYTLCCGLVGLEYPYLTPLLPMLALLLAARRRDWRLVAATVVGLSLVYLAVKQVGRGQVDFGSGRHGYTVSLFGLHWPAAETSFSRAAPDRLFWPTAARWSEGSADGTFTAVGREYLGLTLVLAALAGLKLRFRQTWPWALASAVGILLATGSIWFGGPGLFALLNGAAASFVRGLTQPTRFLVLASVGLPIAAAHAVDALVHDAAHRPWLAALGARARLTAGGVMALAVGGLLVDAFAFGGLSLTMPTTTLPDAPCVAALRNGPTAPVLTVPWDFIADSEASMASRRWQIVHGQPAPGFGVGSWTLLGPRSGPAELDERNLTDIFHGQRPISGATAWQLGYRWIVGDVGSAPFVAELLEGSLGAPNERCGAAVLYALTEHMRPPPPGRNGLPAAPEEWLKRAEKRASDRKDHLGRPIAN